MVNKYIFVGLRATVETCLSLEFTPPLSITGRSARPSSNVALLVSTLSLSSWYLAHSPSMSEVHLIDHL